MMEQNKRKRRQRFLADPLTSPVKKRKPNKLSTGERTMIINVYKYVMNTWPEDQYRSNTEFVKKASEITGVSQRAIYDVLKTYKETHSAEPEKKPKNKKMGIIEKLDNFEKSAIRQIVHSFFFANEIPTVEKVLKKINEDDDLPNLSKTTLRRVLEHLKFKFMTRKNRKSTLIDRKEIILWRTKYLAEIEKYRSENRNIYYLDETWVNAGHTVSKVWTDTAVQSSHQAFVEGVSTGLKNPTGKGKRLIVVHVGNEDGFIESCDLVFESSKTGDYHESMDAPHFEKWFGNVLQKLKKDDVVVMDNASYHSRRLEKTPTTSWRKQEIIDWLQSKDIFVRKEDNRTVLLEKAKAKKQNYQSYVIDEMAKEKGVTVLRLPPYHCELNPIELIWADVKGYVARNNTTFKFSDVKNLLNEGLAKVTPEKWRNCVEHVKKEEQKMRTLDHRIDITIEPLIINVTESSEEESSDSSSDMSSLE